MRSQARRMEVSLEMSSPADVDPLDDKTADILLAKDQHGNYQELDQEAVPPILLLDCIVYKREYGTRVWHLL